MSSFIQLPIDDFLPEILQQLTQYQNLVLSAAPGAGKTTRLPPRLIELTQKKVLVLEPRRVAALAAAQRVADENEWTLGKEVGYQVRFENRSEKSTRLLFITEALLSRKLVHDPELKDVGIIVIDEFHERSLHTDLALGLIYELQQLSRPDLKIIVMSATIKAQAISKFLNMAVVIEIPGQSFPLSINRSNDSQLLNTGPQFLQRVAEKVKSATHSATGDVLVFLPGVGEIERLTRELEVWSEYQRFSLHQLFGNMPLAEQKQVLQKGKNKKIILATNVAESALTIDGVTCVIDTGLVKTVSLSLSTALPKIQISRISKASATQRAGRAARQGPGEVHRLWNKLDELSMPDFEVAEVFKSDLAESLLLLARLGIRDFTHFSWFEIPPLRRLQIAQEQLISWGALSPDGFLTSVGKQMSELPIHPRLARLMIEGEKLYLVQLASELCAILSEKDFLPAREQLQPSSSDLLLRWDIFDKNRQQNRFRSHLKLSQAIAQNFKLTSFQKNQENQLEKNLAKLLLPAYSDLLCRRRKSGETKAIKIDGVGVRLAETSSLKNGEFFVALQLMEGAKDTEAIVNMASEIPLDLIRQQFSNQIKEEFEIYYDEKAQRLLKTIVQKIQKMPLENSRAVPLSEAELEKHLPQVALAQWEWLLRENEELNQWLQRLDWLQRQKLEFELLPFSTEDKLMSLTEAADGCRNLQELKSKDLICFFQNQLTIQAQTFLKEHCPATILVPTGNRLKLKYFPDKNPVLEVRLQEIFGWNETPKILNDKIPVTLHLLGPNYRPMQVTQDLANFWRGAYQEVRKELRARYPKHSWPEDPLTAKPVAKGRSQKT